MISKEILGIPRNSKEKLCTGCPRGNGAKCFPGAAALESKRLYVGPLQKKLPGASSHFFELWEAGFEFPGNPWNSQEILGKSSSGKLRKPSPRHQPTMWSTSYGPRCGFRADGRGPPACGCCGREILIFPGFPGNPGNPGKIGFAETSDPDEENYFPKISIGQRV